MYLETIIDKEPDLQIIYYYEEDVGATLLETTWDELDKFCHHQQPYQTKLEYYDPKRADVSQTYQPTTLKQFIDHLNPGYRKQLIGQFVAYCQNCQPSQTIAFYP